MEDTYSNLVKENQLLRSQLDSMRDRTLTTHSLRSQIQGARAGDLLVCDEENFDAVVATVVEPSGTAVEIYAGKRPLRWLHPKVHVFIEPDRSKADSLATTLSESLVLNTTARDFLGMAPAASVDCIVIRDLEYSHVPRESSEIKSVRHRSQSSTVPADYAFPLVDQARRVARRQLVALCTPEDPLKVNDVPSLFEGTSAGYVNHRSMRADGPYPVDFQEGIIVLNTGDRTDTTVREFAVILNAVRAAKENVHKIRLVVLSSIPPIDFHWSGSDVIICDVDIVDQVSELPAGTIIPMPLKLLRTAMNLPTEILRSTILNFTFLEHYLQCIPVVGVGTDAEFVIADMQSRTGKPVANHS